jgi:hypothetical protein
MTTAKDDLLGMLRGGDTAKSLATQMLETFPSMIDLLSESEQAEARQVMKELGGVNAFNTLMAKKAEMRQRVDSDRIDVNKIDVNEWWDSL